MTEEFKLPNLLPPSGGLESLRRNINARRRRIRAMAGGLTILAIVAILGWPDAVDQLEPEARNDLRVRNGASLEVATGRKDVRFYWVMSMKPASDGDPGTS